MIRLTANGLSVFQRRRQQLPSRLVKWREHEKIDGRPSPVMDALALSIDPINASLTFRAKAYEALRAAIASMNIYDSADEIRLDERRLVAELGVSRTPIREALVLLEKDGIVRNIPRRGVFVVRKTKREIVEIINVWAALESFAARLVATGASESELAQLRHHFDTFDASELSTHIDEYSDANLAFHQRILELSHCQTLFDTAATLFIHMRAIRHKTISENRRFERSIKDHHSIIDALEARDADLAERLVREHALDLATHVEINANYLT
jgi:DNA-binding GntR family transcriptional regulator